MKKMIIVIAVVLVMVVFMGCKYVRGQILDGPGMERDSTDYPQEKQLGISEMPKTAVRQENGWC